MPQARRSQIHNQRLPILQPGFGLQRRGCRGYRASERQRGENWVDDHEPELGSKLAVERRFGRPVAVFQTQSQRPTILHVMEHSPGQLAVRSNLHRQEFQSLTIKKSKQQHFQGFPAIILFPFLPFLGANFFFSFFFQDGVLFDGGVEGFGWEGRERSLFFFCFVFIYLYLVNILIGGDLSENEKRKK